MYNTKNIGVYRPISYLVWIQYTIHRDVILKKNILESLWTYRLTPVFFVVVVVAFFV